MGVESEQPKRLRSFQRRLGKLQDRFGQALKRLAVPSHEISGQAAEERRKREAVERLGGRKARRKGLEEKKEQAIEEEEDDEEEVVVGPRQIWSWVYPINKNDL